jgi:fructose-bisphosphate aldolase class II
MRKYVESGKDLEGKNYDPRKFLKPGFDAITETAKGLITDFGSDGKGWA